MSKEIHSPQRRSRKKQRKNFGPILVILLAAVIGGIVFGYNSVFNNTKPVDAGNHDLQEFVVDKGASTKKIAAQLEEAGLINSSLSFQVYVKQNGFDGKLRNGTYLLSSGMSTEEIVDSLLNGIGETIKFTIPEGYTTEEIAGVFVTNNIMSEEDFWQVIENGDFSQYDFLADQPMDRHRLEGYLFPDTYIIAKGSSPEAVIKAMLDRFSVVKSSLPDNKSGLSFDDMVILASLVESEARVDEDRDIIASVYLNRMETDMPLQCDATVQYAMPERKERLLYSDYKYESPYNTYLFTGLPPTAICNPGEKSLIAACQPADTEYFYYLWDKTTDGNHVFAKTYNEHLKNRERYGYN